MGYGTLYSYLLISISNKRWVFSQFQNDWAAKFSVLICGLLLVYHSCYIHTLREFGIIVVIIIEHFIVRLLHYSHTYYYYGLPYVIGQTIIFLPCDYGRPRPYVIGGPLYFCPVVSIFYLLSFFSSPNLSGRRLDVYHTSTHGVALVSIYLLSSFFPRLISAVGDWISTILLHMAWP